MCFFGYAGLLFKAWKNAQFLKEDTSRNKAFFRASGEAILGTLKYFTKGKLAYFFRASGEPKLFGECARVYFLMCSPFF